MIIKMTGMSEKTADRITEYLRREGGIKTDDAEIYRYGFDVFIYSFMQLMLLLAIGAAVHRISATIIYLASALSLRRYTGGFHARTRLGCTCIACLLLGAVLFATSFCRGIFIYPVTYPVCAAFYLICFALYVPVEHENKPLSDKQKRTYKRWAFFISIFWLTIAVIAKYLRADIGDVIISALVVVAVSIVVSPERRCGNG